MKLTIFISYSHQDVSLVTPIVRLLRATEGLVFLDADSIKPGKKWQQELTKGLETAKLVVVFWCNHSGQSAEVQKEYAAAIAAGKDLLPVLLDSYPVPDDLAEFQWIDFREIVGPAHGFSAGPIKLLEPPKPLGSWPRWDTPLGFALPFIAFLFIGFIVTVFSPPLKESLPPVSGPYPIVELLWSPKVIALGMLILGLLSALLYALIKNFTAKDIIPEGTSQDEESMTSYQRKMAAKLRDEIVQRTHLKA